MVHSDSHISIRSLHLVLLFTHVDYMSMICLTKCMPWLVGNQLRSWTSICFSTFISMLLYWFEEMDQFWVVSWALSMRKWLKSRGLWHNTDNFGPQSLAGRPVRVTLGCPKRPKTTVGPKDMLFEWLTCLLRVLLVMVDVCMVCFRRFHFVNVT